MSLDNAYHGVSDRWATSFLKSSGSHPPKISIEDLYKAYDKDDPSEIERIENQLIQYHNWSCKYSAVNLRDDNVNTAWVEGKEGDGIGEIVLCEIDINYPVEIYAGFGKSDKLYHANNRLKTIKVYLLKAININDHQNGVMYSNLVKLSENTLTLKDINAFQELPIELSNAFDNSIKHLIAIEIIDVYKGTHYDDTCISEIRNIK